MRALPVLTALAIASASADAIEIASEATASDEFVYASSSCKVGLLDDQIELGAGHTMVSDWKMARHGARALLDITPIDSVTLGVEASYAPIQDRRGWFTLEAHMDGERRLGTVSLSGNARALYRRTAAELHGGSVIPIEQLQIEVSEQIAWPASWELGGRLLLSSFAPDLSATAFRRADLGLAVTEGRRPERWAAEMHLSRRFTVIEMAVALVGIAYADHQGYGIEPKLRLRAGPWHGVSLEGGIGILADVPLATGIRAIGSLALEIAP